MGFPTCAPCVAAHSYSDVALDSLRADFISDHKERDFDIRLPSLHKEQEFDSVTQWLETVEPFGLGSQLEGFYRQHR